VSWLSVPGAWLGRLLFERALAAVYLIAFTVALNQFRPLLGDRGLTPVRRFLALVSFRESPSLFKLHYSDRTLVAVAWGGIALALTALVGLPDRGPIWAFLAVWLALWALYLSIVNVGQVWYGFGWESLLLETGFLAAFLGPSRIAPPTAVLWLLRWLLFRLEFGAGLIKLRGDPCWRDLTCLWYHHETQPMPNPLSRLFHHLPRPIHRLEAVGNYAAQLGAPVGLFLPQPVAGAAAAVMIVTQCWLLLSGNFSWLNVLTITIALPALPDAWLRHVLPATPPASFHAPPGWYEALVLLLLAGTVVLSWWPVRNMASGHQVMNSSFNRLHLVNTYGAFGSVTRVRHEIVIEGTADREIGPDTVWREYDLKGKPTDPFRRPRQIAPYHLRLDWLLWFAALSPRYAEAWFGRLLVKLLENDRPTLRLLARNPFPDDPPAFVRARLYRYRFTDRRRRRTSGAWWERTLVGEYAPALSLETFGLQPPR
jgi:hypothetical protein